MVKLKYKNDFCEEYHVTNIVGAYILSILKNDTIINAFQ